MLTHQGINNNNKKMRGKHIPSIADLQLLP